VCSGAVKIQSEEYRFIILVILFSVLFLLRLLSSLSFNSKLLASNHKIPYLDVNDILLHECNFSCIVVTKDACGAI